MASELEKCCLELESGKITSRKIACDELNELLRQKSTIEFLNSGKFDYWNKIRSALEACLIKDHEKKLDECRKKGSTSPTAPQSADLFALFIRMAIKESAPTISFRKLLEFLINWVKDGARKSFHHTFLKILSESFLLSAQVRNSLKDCDWEALYSMLKSQCGGSISDSEQVKCLALVIKWGPLHKFPVTVLREEFAFVTKLCKMVTSASPKPQQDAVLELAFDFCKHTAKDNRMACCKLGEDIFQNFLDLYQGNEKAEKMKANLIEFFLFQIAIHNPKGVKENEPASYAVCWDSWKLCLSNIYDILTSEIDKSLELTIKNQSLFVCTNGMSQLFDSFVNLFVEVCRQLFSCHNCGLSEPPRKRTKTEFTVANLIEKTRETKSWMWLNLTYPLVEAYPEMITPDDYVTLLKNLVTLQSENKQPDLHHHIHRALLVLLKIDVTSQQVDSLWRGVAESCLRLTNQNDEHLQMLLQELIAKKYVTSHENFLQLYRALDISEHNLKTVDVAFRNFPILQFDGNLKIEMIRWVLSSQSQEFWRGHVAETLVCLVLKQWRNQAYQSDKKIRPFADLEDVYFTISFKNLLVCEDSHVCQVDSIVCADQSLLSFLLDQLTSLLDSVTLHKCVLVFNVISYLIKFDLIKNLEDLNLYKLFKSQVCDLFGKLNFKITKFEERKVTKLTGYVQMLSVMFLSNVSDFVSSKLRELVPEQLIKDMFGTVANSQFEDVDQLVVFKKTTMETLVRFSCLPTDNLLPNQERALEALLNFEYDCTNDGDYDLLVTLLSSIVQCKPKALSESNMVAIFNLFQKMCESRYNCYLSAVKILDLFYDIYPFVAASDSDLNKSQFVEILYPFYVKRLSYGPALSISLLNCMGLLFELEPTSVVSKWSNEQISQKIPEFLTSDYQEVRFTAIKTIASFFKVSSKTRLLEQYHQQEMMFSKVSQMSLQVLRVEGNVSATRLVDETLARTSSILHTFASIMVSSFLWVEEALFTLLKIVCNENLGLSQAETVIEIVATKLGFESGLKLLEKYLVGLVNRWKSNFDTFPFRIFNCDSKIQLYTKYWASLSHIFVGNEENSLNQVASNLGKSLQKLIEDSCPKLLSYCIGQEVSDLGSITNNKIYQLLNDTLGIEKSRQIFKNNVEEIILCLSDFISDEQVFEASFHQKIIFPKVGEIRLSVGEFQDCLQFIETSLYSDNSVVSYLMANTPQKIHFMLLQLNLRVNTVEALEEKMRYFHLYSIIASLCVDSVLTEPSMQPYLIRDLTHTLLHHIKNHKNQLELSQMSCKFFTTLLNKILPSLSKTVSQFFLVIVSRLKYIALENCPISNACVEMLDFLIVKHKDLFVDEIEKLDSVPQTSQFEKISSVHFLIKYNNRKVTLEDEIVQFLDFGKNIESLDECEHSLTHLRTLLLSRKDELKSMYCQLRQSRGFSEDCESSNLHKLICMLITLSCSTNRNVSTEAVRCLGEVGPADLATLILQPEKGIPETKWTPWELVVGCAVSLLSKYLVDGDVAVIRGASVALFQILSTKEGRKVAESQTDFGFGAINCGYLTPFCAITLRKTVFSVNVNGDLFVKVVKNDDLWMPQECCHNTWVTRLVCTFLETFQEAELFATFINMCKLKVEFCEQILPLIIYTVLYLNTAALTRIISAQIENFFNRHWDITVKNQSRVGITTNKSSVQSMLNVVHFVRLQRSVRKKEIKELKLDYLRVAKAAHFCAAHFTALLYAEIWCQEQINQSANDYALSTCSHTKLDLIYEKLDEITRNALQNILRQAYKAVGEADAFLGCGTAHLLNPSTRVEHYKELGRWEQVRHFYEMEVSLGRQGALPPLIDTLKNANLYQLSLLCSDEPNYESLWRLGQWSYTKSDLSDNTYDKCKFNALKSLHDNEELSFKEAMNEGRVCVVQDFMAANMESIKNFYSTFARLQSLNEIEEFAQAVKNNEILDLLVKWKVQDDIISNDYQYVEPVQAQRIVLLTDLLKSQSHWDHLRDVIVDSIIDYARCARIEGQSFVAWRILGNLRLLSCANDGAAKIQLEEAQLCWSIQDVVTAKCILRQLCNDENVNPRLHAMALKMTGEWMAESSSENRQTIIESYFQKSLSLIKRNVEKTKADEKSILDTFDQLAKFADHEYQEVMSHIKSDVFQKKKQNMLKARETFSGLNPKNIKKLARDLQKAIHIKQKLSCIDEIEINNIETDKNNLLGLALKYYLLNLIGSDDHNITIFRLFSLLLENRANEIVKPVLERDLSKIPTYKFISVLPQIIPHISSTSNDVFSQAVVNIIEKCAQDHPYHTLPLILSLALSNKDRDYTTDSKAPINDARMQSAESILTKLKKNPHLLNLIGKMELVSEAVIELAYYKTDGADDRSFRVPKKCKITKIQNFDDVLLPTYTLPVSKSRDYEKIVGIRSFSHVYSNVGGINAPKRITCTGTDGITRSQLIKGQDDLRQDAVMEQVFTIMNSLLSVNKQTKNLQIRTYKIVPLSMRSGILEWVDNTMPIGEYLTGERGDGGAHVKFRPMDKSPLKCRADFKVAASSKSNEERMRCFKKICENIKPIFHKFFETQFPQPTVWYERRRAYIHSVATSSMCGYILGIGDRHFNNILIDKSTAEVVHIDFGIAFEQGRVLPTPETVPFRLTRDIVDGMGVSGIEGVFRRSCEKTVEVLRLHYQTIITILEVLLYDPLYDWTVSSAEANKRQKDEQDDSEFTLSGGSDESPSQDVNVTAERALLRLRAKLQGTESGKSTTVEHQVATLIQQAVDPSNLSRLFHGWQPYL